MRVKNKAVYQLVMSSMFLAVGIVLPFFTGQIQQIGNMLLPMHLPVMLCGLICSWKYGLVVGAILPLLRSLLFGMPVLYPNAVAMAFECAMYGFLIGFLFEISKKKSVGTLYKSLICSMVGGRLVWGAVMLALMGIRGKLFTFSAFAAGALLNAIPGIILQLVLVPSIMVMLDRIQYKFYKQKIPDKKGTQQ